MSRDILTGKSMVSPRFRQTLAALSVASLGAAHLIATIVYLSPENPIRQRSSLLLSYIERVFPQDWHLFSPDPGTTSASLLIRCTRKTGTQTAWLDPVASVIRSGFEHPLGPYQKLSYVYQYVTSDLYD